MAESKPEILLLASRFQVRGSSAYTLRLAQRLPACGVSSRVVCPDAQLVDARKRSALNVQEYPRLDSPLWGRLMLRRLCRGLRANPPRLIHVQTRGMLPQGVWLCRRLQIPFVLTVHDYLYSHEKLRIDTRWCRRVIAVSEAVRTDLLARTGLPASLVTVIPSGVDVREHGPCAVPLDAGHVPVVGTAGPLEALKGLPFFLGAAKQVLSAGRDVEFLIAGAGPEESNLRRMARELGISNKVTFVPYLLEFKESLEAMDIFCLPSLQQGLGTVMLEAMALGRPVIATSVGGVHSIVRDGQTGLLVPPSNSSELARRMRELLDDPPRAQQIGATARSLVEEEFSVEQMVQHTIDLYRTVLGEQTVPVVQAVTT